MTWHCSRALVEAYSARTFSVGAPFALSNATHTPDTFCWPDRTKDSYRHSRYGTTCELLTEGLGAELLTWYRAASLARISALPEEAKALTENIAACGPTWHASLAKYDRDTSMWRTHQLSLFEGSAEYLATWPRWGLMLDGECWALPSREPSTSASAYGYWPTPFAQLADRKIRLREDDHNNLHEWMGRRFPHLVGQRLDPDYAEWMMGWPIGWSDLTPLEMDKYQLWQQQHSVCFPNLGKGNGYE